MYDPRKDLADCDRCPLRNERLGPPVKSEFNPSGRFTIVGEAPGAEESKKGIPFAGRSGYEEPVGLFPMLRPHAIKRKDLVILNALCCQPPKKQKGTTGSASDLEVYIARCSQRGLASPLDCCRPRLQRELEIAPRDIILAGRYAAQTVLGVDKGIFELLGDMVTTEDHTGEDSVGEPHGVLPGGARVVPILHPALVLRQRYMFELNNRILGMAIRWFRNEPDWARFTKTLMPSVQEFKAFLARVVKAGWFAYDIETDGIRFDTTKMRCFSLAIEDEVCVVPVLSKDGHTRFYAAGTIDWFLRLFHDVMCNTRVTKLSQNGRYFDRMILTETGVLPPDAEYLPIDSELDIIMLDKSVHQRARHDLETIARTMTDAPKWKDKKDLNDSTGDMNLWERNALDSITTARAGKRLVERCATEGIFDPVPLKPEWSLADMMGFMQDYARDMHRCGMFIDLPKVRAKMADNIGKADKQLSKVKRLATRWGFSDLNPNSPVQMSKLFFETWGEIPGKFTAKTGRAAVTDDIARDMIFAYAKDSDDEESQTRSDFLYARRRYRSLKKIISTYLARLLPQQELDWYRKTGQVDMPADGEQDDDHPGTQSFNFWPDGRVRCDWNAHATPIDRFSCSSPGWQQYAWYLRDVVVPMPGCKIVHGDVDQFHPRIFTNLWDIGLLRDAFQRGLDPYVVFAVEMLGKRMTSAEGYAGTSKKPKKNTMAQAYRDLHKEFLLSFAYGAMTSTILVNLRAAEDEDGNLTLGHLNYTSVDFMREKALRLMPEFEAGWLLEKQLAIQNGMDNDSCPFVKVPLSGRRVYLEGGVDDREEKDRLRNARVLGSEATFMHVGVSQFLDECRRRGWWDWGARPEDLLNGHAAIIPIMQYHDDPAFESVESIAQEAADLLSRCLTRKCIDWEIPITATGVVSDHWE